MSKRSHSSAGDAPCASESDRTTSEDRVDLQKNIDTMMKSSSSALLNTIPFDLLCIAVGFLRLRELVVATTVCRDFRKSARFRIIQAWPSLEPLFHVPFKLKGWDLINKTSLHFKNIELGNDGMKALSTGIASGALANLKDLRLHHNQIDDEGMKAFTKAIGSGSLGALKLLILSDNQIGDEGMKSIASGSLGALQVLLLAENQIGNDGMIALAKALEPNDKFPMGSLAKLTHLGISSNQIGDEGIKAFSSAIGSGALGSLVELNLYNNRIGNEGMKAFSTAIASGSLGSLKRLFLFYNVIGDAGMAAFAEALKPNEKFPIGSLGNLQNLYLDGNPGNNMGVKEACSARGIVELHPGIFCSLFP